MLCKICGTEMVIGQVLYPHTDYDHFTIAPVGPATEMRKCWKCPKCGHSEEIMALVELREDSRGNRLYVEENEVGGHRYWSDEIGGGVVVWDTSLVSREMLLLALEVEEKREKEEKT